MKHRTMQKTLSLIFLFLLSGVLLLGQSKEKDLKADQEAEMKAKKEMLEEQEQQMRQLEYQYAEQARTAERAARDSSRSYARSSSRSSGSSPGNRVFVSSTGDHDDYFVYSGFNQDTQTQLTLRNSFDGASIDSKGQFEVDESTRHFRVMINGKVKSGEIRIIVDYPNGDTFKDLVINSAAEISFSQSVTIGEEDPDKYIGEWDYKVIAEEAKGTYMLQIQTH